ncbi:MAG TPA: hypothetical protein VG389_17380 [Myxococcota bacterium]|nr:hypothetical protein [Myxococcota bacterium]
MARRASSLWTRARLVAVAAVATAAAAVAAGGAAGCDIGTPVDAPPRGVVEGAISYAGAETGALVVEAYDAMPPVGPPLARVEVAAPHFPQPYRLEGLEGEAFLTARVGAALGTYPTVLAVSPVVVDGAAGLRGADFAVLDEGTRPEGPVTINGARTLSGTVRYAGAVAPGDALRGALYRSYPASGTPADFQILNVGTPVFPYAFTFRDVRDGAYYVVFYLDRGGDSPFGPGTEDLVAWTLGPDAAPRALTIALGAGQSGADVTLPAK